ncbi:hypothetical protein ABS768_13205 [Flavobacterium sp. ST-75]|uniref:Lipoprotein n=1 Tax=Flavobacterium rhizophilum TaxID=3163296 RepID=A0ABW8YE15_9FLAO
MKHLTLLSVFMLLLAGCNKPSHPVFTEKYIGNENGLNLKIKTKHYRSCDTDSVNCESTLFSQKLYFRDGEKVFNTVPEDINFRVSNVAMCTTYDKTVYYKVCLFKQSFFSAKKKLTVYDHKGGFVAEIEFGAESKHDTIFSDEEIIDYFEDMGNKIIEKKSFTALYSE